MGAPLTDAVSCKGSWSLGTACGDCRRCRSSLPEAKETIQRLLKRLEPTRQEWEAAWEITVTRQREAGLAEDYQTAISYKARAQLIWAQMQGMRSDGPKTIETIHT